MEKEHNLLESDVVTLTLDDDVEIECAIITTFNMDSTEYIALLPLDEDGGNEDGDVWIYRFIRDTTGGSDHDLQNIEVEMKKFYESYLKSFSTEQSLKKSLEKFIPDRQRTKSGLPIRVTP